MLPYESLELHSFLQNSTANRKQRVNIPYSSGTGSVLEPPGQYQLTAETHFQFKMLCRYAITMIKDVWDELVHTEN